MIAGILASAGRGTGRACLDPRNMRDRCGLSSRGLAVLIPTVLTLVACSPPTEPRPPRTLPATSAPGGGAVGRLPMAFEPNTGQAPADVRVVGGSASVTLRVEN